MDLFHCLQGHFGKTLDHNEGCFWIWWHFQNLLQVKCGGQLYWWKVDSGARLGLNLNSCTNLDMRSPTSYLIHLFLVCSKLENRTALLWRINEWIYARGFEKHLTLTACLPLHCFYCYLPQLYFSWLSPTPPFCQILNSFFFIFSQVPVEVLAITTPLKLFVLTLASQ